jgi:hypothetical protein
LTPCGDIHRQGEDYVGRCFPLTLRAPYAGGYHGPHERHEPYEAGLCAGYAEGVCFLLRVSSVFPSSHGRQGSGSPARRLTRSKTNCVYCELCEGL